MTNDQVNLFADIEEQEKKQREAADYERRKAVPGLLSVNEMTSEFDQI